MVSDGYILQVGDTIIKVNRFGEWEFEVTRVTKRYAFCKSEYCERKFPRVYDDFSFEPLPRSQYRLSSYNVRAKQE